MLKQLRPKLGTLPTSSDAMGAEVKRDERAEYIDGRIRLHLERAGQLTLGDAANPVVGGRKIDLGEARALEVVTGMLRERGTEGEGEGD